MSVSQFGRGVLVDCAIGTQRTAAEGLIHSPKYWFPGASTAPFLGWQKGSMGPMCSAQDKKAPVSLNTPWSFGTTVASATGARPVVVVVWPLGAMMYVLDSMRLVGATESVVLVPSIEVTAGCIVWALPLGSRVIQARGGPCWPMSSSESCWGCGRASALEMPAIATARCRRVIVPAISHQAFDNTGETKTMRLYVSEGLGNQLSPDQLPQED